MTCYWCLNLKKIILAKKLFEDNNVSVEFYPNDFSVKDLAIHTTMLIGVTKHGL